MRKGLRYKRDGETMDLVRCGSRYYPNFDGEMIHGLSRIFAPAPEDALEMLRRLRVKYKWTQAYAAAVFGVPKITYRKWESGEYRLKGAARKLVWLLHELLSSAGKVKNHRDVALWGDAIMDPDTPGNILKHLDSLSDTEFVELIRTSSS